MSAEIRDVDTWGMPVRFAPRQHESGACWILIEQLAEPTLPILDEGFMGMHLAEGTTWKQAMILADLLSRRVRYLMYTGPNRAAWADNPGCGARAKQRKSRSSSLRSCADTPFLDAGFQGATGSAVGHGCG